MLALAPVTSSSHYLICFCKPANRHLFNDPGMRRAINNNGERVSGSDCSATLGGHERGEVTRPGNDREFSSVEHVNLNLSAVLHLRDAQLS
jgi:hypothetical protein